MWSKEKSNPKIVFTGGHAATTALAVIQKIKEQGHIWTIYWIGPGRAIEGKKVAPIELSLLPDLGVHVKKITAGRVQRKWTVHTIPSILKIPFGFIHAFYLLLTIRPQVVVSFGGYAAFPVILAAYILGIPTILHEQTMAVGLANKLSGLFADKIALAREVSRKFFPKGKTVVTGNPITKELLTVAPKAKLSARPVIYVTGGSRGAQVINKALDEVLEALLVDYQIIHQAGDLDIEYFQERKRKLPDTLDKNYEVFSFVEPWKIQEVYSRADMLVSRAGANTVAEILLTRRPAVLIPIPWSRFNEQYENAKMARSAGIAVILSQEELTGVSLRAHIEKVRSNWVSMAGSKASEESVLDRAASEKMVELIEASLQGKGSWL